MVTPAQIEQDNNDTVVTKYNANNLDVEKAVSINTTLSNDQKPQSVKKYYDDDSSTLEKIHTGVDEASIIEPPSDDTINDIPDGGYGWAIVLSGFFANVVMFGCANTYGLFSQAFATSILEGKASTLELMTVGSLINVCLNVFSPVSVLLIRFGTRFNYAIGSILMCLGIFLAGFTTEIWHLYLTQGFLFGFGASFLYMSVASVIPQWFSTRRATAMGIATCGSGLGGLSMSPLVNHLISKYGIPWAYRILGFFCLGLCIVGTILIKDRIPAHRKNQPVKSPIQLSMFKMVNFDIWLVGSVIGVMGYLGPMFYLPKYAADIGLSPSDGSNMLSILCAVNAVARIVLGFVADKIGRLNMFIIASILSGIFSFVIWPFATSFNNLLVFCILWGATSGTYYVLAAPITASVVGMDKLSAGLSIAFIISAIAAMGTPIMAAIQQATPNNGYIGIQMFDGAVYVLGALICVFLKFRLSGSLLSKF